MEEVDQKQEYFVQIAKKKQDEIEIFRRKNRSNSKKKKSAAEGGRIFFDPFFDQNRRKMTFFRIFCPKNRIKSKIFQKKQLQTMEIGRKKHKWLVHPILAILVNLLQKKRNWRLREKMTWRKKFV